MARRGRYGTLRVEFLFGDTNSEVENVCPQLFVFQMLEDYDAKWAKVVIRIVGILNSRWFARRVAMFSAIPAFIFGM